MTVELAGAEGQVGRHDVTGRGHGRVRDLVVNGLSGDRLDWDAVQWRRVEADVQRLRQRIFAASRAGDLKKVRNLQKLMLRSRSNALLAVRRVTQLNAGRLTAGVDGEVVVTVVQRAEMAHWLQHHAEPWSPAALSKTLGRESSLTP